MLRTKRTCLMTGTSGLRGARNTTGSLFLSNVARSPSAMYSHTMYGTVDDPLAASAHTHGAACRYTTAPANSTRRSSNQSINDI